MDRYGRDVLSHDPHGARRSSPEVSGEPGIVVECASSGFCGEIIGWVKTSEGWAVRLEDRHGRERLFPAHRAGFLLEGQPVTLVRPSHASTSAPTALRSASGSIAVTGHRAVVAAPSRLWVEGIHDAELVEKVWGHDLRVAGVVVEPLHGIDDMVIRVQAFQPTPDRRLGVLVDHLVPGSKESRIAEEAMTAFPDAALVLGHPFVDIWSAVKPAVAGIPEWPAIPRGEDWKSGVCRRLGWAEDTGLAWKRLLSRVSRWTDLDPGLLGPVEELIDFVTAPGSEGHAARS